MTKITLLCTNSQHPIFTYLKGWCEKYAGIYHISLWNSVEEITEGGDILFLISCSEIIKQEVRDLFQNTLVLHASKLPEGRGWSPHIWDIVNGKNNITLSLLEAEDSVDTGAIWKQKEIPLQGGELYNEINELLFKGELELITWACDNYQNCIAKPQPQKRASYHPKRTPQHSELDINKSIEEQFNLLRVCDPDRFPAYFIVDGQKYKIRIERDE